MSDLNLDAQALNNHLQSVLDSLTPSARAELGRKIARVLLNKTRQSLRDQESPDGKPWKKRKQGEGRINRRKMFVRMRLAKHLKIRNRAGQAVVGWVGSAARIGRIHHFGLRDSDNSGARYPARELIGIAPEHIELVEDTILNFIAADK